MMLAFFGDCESKLSVRAKMIAQVEIVLLARRPTPVGANRGQAGMAGRTHDLAVVSRSDAWRCHQLCGGVIGGKFAAVSGITSAEPVNAVTIAANRTKAVAAERRNSFRDMVAF
jgi:hypothetical protein